MRFFLMFQGSFKPKIRFLGQKVCSVVRGQTNRLESEYRGHPFRFSGFFFFNIVSISTKTMVIIQIHFVHYVRKSCPWYWMPPCVLCPGRSIAARRCARSLTYVLMFSLYCLSVRSVKSMLKNFFPTIQISTNWSIIHSLNRHYQNLSIQNSGV